MGMIMRSSECGIYGKVPIVGDFISRRMSQKFINIWDEWLQACISSSKLKLGEEWLKYYLVSPIWRYIITNKISGEGHWAGVIVPSVDRVGRYFPLTISIQLEEIIDPFSIISSAEITQVWFEQLEAVSMLVLNDDSLTLDDFDDRVCEIDNQKLLSLLPKQSDAISFDKGLNHLSFTMSDMSCLSHCVSLLANNYIQREYDSWSAWWTKGSHQVSPKLFFSHGMPSADDYSGMITGEWPRTLESPKLNAILSDNDDSLLL